MSLDKAILHKKEHRKLTRQASKYCWNHGGCSYCLSGRMYRTNKEKQRTDYDKETILQEKSL
jgi:hypothetical protein